MEFRLTYRGALPASGRSDSRGPFKQQIRKYLHPQIRSVWRTHPWLGEAEDAADTFARNGFRFAPLIQKNKFLSCAVNILFLRRDDPGSIVGSGGDLDNRIKTLFDGLRMPETFEEVGKLPPEVDENPFFCLLETDQLITDINVTTDRLLTPMQNDDRQNDVELVIHVVSNLEVVINTSRLSDIESSSIETRASLERYLADVQQINQEARRLHNELSDSVSKIGRFTDRLRGNVLDS